MCTATIRSQWDGAHPAQQGCGDLVWAVHYGYAPEIEDQHLLHSHMEILVCKWHGHVNWKLQSREATCSASLINQLAAGPTSQVGKDTGCHWRCKPE